MDHKKLINKLKKINKTKSYERIGREMNVSGQTVYRWIKGENKPSNLAIEKIEKFVSAQ